MCEGCEERIHVGHQVHRIDRSISKLLEMRVKEEGLDEIALMHGWILRYLYEHQDKEIYQKDIEKYFNIRRSTATGLLNSLEKNGYITKEPVENDKRMKKIKATEHAYSTVEKIDNHVIQLEKIMLDGIDEKEVKQFRNTISKMTLNLVKESKNG